MQRWYAAFARKHQFSSLEGSTHSFDNIQGDKTQSELLAGAAQDSGLL